MAVIDPVQNKNFLAPQGFQLFLKRAPNLNYFCQVVNVPGVELGVVETPTPFINIPLPGDHLRYEELEVTFKVNEDLANFLEISNWMLGLGFPDDFSQYAALNVQPQTTGLGVKSDITLLVANSKRNMKFEVVFRDAFPTALSGIRFDSTLEDLDYISASARFSFTRYEINPIA